MECGIGKYRSPDSDDADQHFLFSPVSELFPDRQPTGRSLIERDPGWGNPFVHVFIRPTARSTDGMDTGISDSVLKWIHRPCFTITGCSCRTFGIHHSPADTGLFCHFLFLPFSDIERKIMV